MNVPATCVIVILLLLFMVLGGCAQYIDPGFHPLVVTPQQASLVSRRTCVYYGTTHFVGDGTAVAYDEGMSLVRVLPNGKLITDANFEYKRTDVPRYATVITMAWLLPDGKAVKECEWSARHD